MSGPDWDRISRDCPDPLPTSIAELDALVRKHRPELYQNAAARGKPINSKRRKSWRQSFVGFVGFARFKQANPEACCFKCEHRKPYSHSKENTFVCDLGFDGPWYTPVKPDGLCQDFKRKAK